MAVSVTRRFPLLVGFATMMAVLAAAPRAHGNMASEPPDPGCTPERENRHVEWTDCRYCPAAWPDPYDERNLELPANYYEEIADGECARLVHGPFRERCASGQRRAVYCRRVSHAPATVAEPEAPGWGCAAVRGDASARAEGALGMLGAIALWLRRRRLRCPK